jgi:hypothetical protein
MRRTILSGLLLGFVFVLPAWAQDQEQQSLGDIARQSRKAKENRDKSTAPATKIFTDENMRSSGVGSADLAQLDSPSATMAERLATARRALARGKELLDTLEPMDRATLAQLALQGQNSDFPGRQAWEEKLFAAKEHYVSHGRDLFRQTEELLNTMQSLTASGKLSPKDPQVTELSHRALQLMQDANRTDADFQAILLEGQDLAKRASSH